jgi:glycogen(starch) synthase
MKILLPTEVYPPRAGGAGWSTRALALALKGAGHEVTVVTTSPGPARDGIVDVTRLRAPGRKRFAVPRVIRAAVAAQKDAVIHAQHSLSALGALSAGAPQRVAVTVRDHWPVCFWSTRISRGALCPQCTLVNMTRCVDGHVPLPRPLSLAAIPYMRTDLAAKRRALLRAGAVLAVSDAIAAELRGLDIERVFTLPNIVDGDETARIAREQPAVELPGKFLLFIGKLEENKGVRLLVPAIAASGTRLPLVVLGEGSLLAEMKFEAEEMGVELVSRGWTHRDDALRALGRASGLVFPSLWPEPLSRVLLEALALGVPIAAMDTGGTREILEDGKSGLIVPDAAGLAQAVARIVLDPALALRLAEGARQRARAFSPEVLVPRYEEVYRRLM